MRQILRTCRMQRRADIHPSARSADKQHRRSPHMLDAFKTIAGGRNKIAQNPTAELEMLIATAREERSAISAMLTALTTRSAKLTPLGKSLEQVSEKASSVTARLDELAKRLESLDQRTKDLDAIDERIEALKESA